MFLKRLTFSHPHSIFTFINQLSYTLLPPLCLLCGLKSTPHLNLCAPCQHSLPILSHHCPQCAHILPINNICTGCQTSPPPFNRTYALLPYQPPITTLITALKFQHQLSYAKLLGELLALKIKNAWYKNITLPDLILPIPLHPKRLKERGFNQALEIARPISHSLALPIDTLGAIRVKHTSAQSLLSATDRKQNMANAFAINCDYTGLSLAVIDDVMTTGHTLSAFCQALKQAGATSIDIWCAARAMARED